MSPAAETSLEHGRDYAGRRALARLFFHPVPAPQHVIADRLPSPERSRDQIVVDLHLLALANETVYQQVFWAFVEDVQSEADSRVGWTDLLAFWQTVLGLPLFHRRRDLVPLVAQ